MSWQLVFSVWEHIPLCSVLHKQIVSDNYLIVPQAKKKGKKKIAKGTQTIGYLPQALVLTVDSSLLPVWWQKYFKHTCNIFSCRFVYSLTHKESDTGWGAAVFQHCEGQKSCLASFLLAFISEKHVLALIDLTVWFWLSSLWSLSQAGCWQAMEYYTRVLIFRKHKAYVAGSESPALPYHRRGKMGFRGRAGVQRGGSSRRLQSIAYNPSHCHAPTETETSKIIWPISQLFEARPGAVCSLQIPEKISKRQRSIVSSSAQPQVFPFTSSWRIRSNIMFRAYLRCSWKSKQSFRQKKGKHFCRWCHFSLSFPSFVAVVFLCGEGEKPREPIWFTASQRMAVL